MIAHLNKILPPAFQDHLSSSKVARIDRSLPISDDLAYLVLGRSQKKEEDIAYSFRDKRRHWSGKND